MLMGQQARLTRTLDILAVDLRHSIGIPVKSFNKVSSLSADHEPALLDRTVVDSRTCKVGSCRSDGPNFLLSACTPADCSPDSIRDTFIQRLPHLLRTADWNYIDFANRHEGSSRSVALERGALRSHFRLGFCRQVNWGDCWPFASSIDCSSQVRTADAPIVNAPPCVHSFRVSDRPRPTSLLATYGKAVYETIGRTEALFNSDCA